VADAIGPERILARFGGGTNGLAAAGVIYSGIDVDNPKGTAILTVSFKHRDPELVQPVLKEVLKAYMKQHVLVREGSGVREEYFTHRRDESLTRLTQKEEALKQAKKEANVLFPEETKKSYETQIAKVQDELLDAQRELFERKAVLGNVGPAVLSEGSTNSAELSVPLDKVDDYSSASTDLEFLKRRQRELLRQYTEDWPELQSVRHQIEKLAKQKAQLEQDYPPLSHVALSSSRGNTNALGSDMAADIAEVKRLAARVSVLGTMLTNLQTEASRVLEIEPTITLLQRQRDQEQKSFEFYANSVARTREGQAQAGGQLISMGIVEAPTPPGLDTKKVMKLVEMIFGGCVGLGLVLAFLMDLVFDRTIKRGLDVERHLHMPVFLTIPDTSWTNRLGLPWGGDKQSKALIKANGVGGNGTGQAQSVLAHWSPVHHLQTYTEGLRERLITYFDVNNMNLKKPKLVGVTGCGAGSGVSTLASGLAAALSKTGDGNVLLVDMNLGEGVAHSFYKGKPGCGISDVLEHEGRADAQIQENLFLASINEEKHENQENQPKALPVKFTNLVPKLKASDYDYIIFDLPPASPTSATPRLASHMDITLLVVESEKTGQQAAARASRLMRESRANVAAVLNKFRPHVPARLSQEL
jgi:Mrp family chromosome partitioning ATPase/uncharacterized protein involved in exopolysaccharide biosynthesis